MGEIPASGVVDIVTEIVRANGASVPVSAESRIVEDLGHDSLAVMDFVMVLEDRFDISIPIDMLNDVKTVGDFAQLIETLRAR